MSTLAERENPRNLAPRWHTAALVGLIVAVALTGTLLASGTSATPDAAVGANRLTDPLALVTAVYLPALIVDWFLVVYVSRVGRGRNELPTLLGRLPRSARAVAFDLSLAFAGFLVIEGGEMAAAHVFGRGGGAGAGRGAILPTTFALRLVWIAFALTAGFCEEVVYRGYLQTQLGAFTRSAIAGIALSAILFGVAHLDQGVATAARFTVYAVGFGALAYGRKSLVPGIVCHVAVDLLSGLST